MALDNPSGGYTRIRGALANLGRPPAPYASSLQTTVHFDGRELTLTRYTQPQPELKLLLEKLRIALPPQSSPKLTAAQAASAPRCSTDFRGSPLNESIG